MEHVRGAPLTMRSRIVGSVMIAEAREFPLFIDVT